MWNKLVYFLLFDLLFYISDSYSIWNWIQEPMNARQSFTKLMLDILVLMTPLFSIEKSMKILLHSKLCLTHT